MRLLKAKDKFALVGEKEVGACRSEAVAECEATFSAFATPDNKTPGISGRCCWTFDRFLFRCVHLEEGTGKVVICYRAAIAMLCRRERTCPRVEAVGALTAFARKWIR